MEDGRVFRGEPLAGFAGGGGVLHSDLYWLVVSIIFYVHRRISHFDVYFFERG